MRYDRNVLSPNAFDPAPRVEASGWRLSSSPTGSMSVFSSATRRRQAGLTAWQSSESLARRRRVVSRRGFARGRLIPRLCRKCTHARSGDAESPVDVAGTVSRGLLVVTNAIEPGRLRVVVYGPLPIENDGVLLNLRFSTVGSTGKVSPLRFEQILFNDGEPDAIASEGLIEIS